MSMLNWAKQEVEILRSSVTPEDESDFNYTLSCAENALKAFEVLCNGGHSGMSIQVTKNFLNRMIEGLPLKSITDIPENWNLVDHHGGKQIFQCKRCSSLFKHIEAGKVRYSSVGNYMCIDINTGSTYTGGGANDIVDELYPITMPYWPLSEKIKMYTEDFLVDPRMGDYDTKAYLYLIHPKDGRVEINRFFAEKERGVWTEIDKTEYEARKVLATAVASHCGKLPTTKLEEENKDEQ